MITIYIVRGKFGRFAATGVIAGLMAAGLAGCGGDTGAAVQATATTDTSSQAVPTTQPADTAVVAAPVATDTAAPSLLGTTDATATTAGTGAGTGASTGAQSGSTAPVAVNATLREWAIDLSQSSVPAGQVQFTVTNTGKAAHNFTITDASGTIAKTSTFASSAGPQTLVADLKPGTYTIICSIPGHAARGQKTELVVK